MEEEKNKNQSIVDFDDLLFVWGVFVKNWYLVVALSLFGWGIGYMYSHQLTNVYMVRTQVLLQSEEAKGIQSNLVGNSYYDLYQDMTNQRRVLASYDMIEAALKKLDFNISYFIVGRIKTTEVYRDMPFTVKMTRLNSALYYTNFNFKLVSFENYEISYLYNGEFQKLQGEYGIALNTADLYLMVKKGGHVNEKNIKT